MNSKEILITLAFMMLVGAKVFSQESIEGTVTYISSQNVYVKFVSTDGISKGDTLLFQGKNGLEPGLLVKELSSISCVCTPIGTVTFKMADKIYFRK